MSKQSGKLAGCLGKATRLRGLAKVFTRSFSGLINQKSPCKGCLYPTTAVKGYCPLCRKKFLKKVFGPKPTKEQPPNTTVDELLNQYKNLL